MTSRIKSFLVFLGRNKLYTFINVLGFAVSLTFVILLGLYIQDECAVDAGQLNRDRIFRLRSGPDVVLPAPLAGDLQARYPEIEAVTRVRDRSFWVIAPDGEGSNQTALLVDSDFFRIFSFPMVEGDAASVMKTPTDIVLTESYARSIFGDKPALGQRLVLDGDNSYIVSGVVRDFTGSHLCNYPFLVPFEVLRKLGAEQFMNSYSSWGTAVYMLERRGADLPARSADITAFAGRDLKLWEGEEKIPDEGLSFQPLSEIYFDNRTENPGHLRTNDPAFIAVLGVTALLVLLFAVINYINLSVAQSGFRAPEAALRRLLGGTKRELFSGFILESVILCLLSFLTALLLASLAEPWFRSLMGTGIGLRDGLTLTNLLYAAAGIVTLGLLSGMVPALVMLRFRPIEIVQGTFRRKTKAVYSRVLIGLQFCITIVLVGCTLTIVRQVRYMERSDLGYRTENILSCDFKGVFSKHEQGALRNRLMAVPGVESVAFSRGYPTRGVDIQMFDDAEGITHSMSQYRGDSAFLAMLEFEVLHRTGVEDPAAVWLNETAWKRLGLAEDATECRACDWWTFRLKGKIRDFHDEDFSRPIGEVMIQELSSETMPYHVLIRVAPGDPFGTRERIRVVYDELAQGKVFDGRFLDEEVGRMYLRQTQLSRMLGALSLLAMVISALGILAMATYYVRQRAAEVAVRKVFGATNREMFGMLLGNSIQLVALAFVVAVPVIWFLMREWLSGYVYRIPVSWTIFVMAGAAVLAVAAAAVFGQARRAANADPIVSLKTK